MLKKVLCLFMLSAIVFTCIFSLQAYADNFDVKAYDGLGQSNINTSVGNIGKSAVTIVRIVSAGIASIMLLAVAMKYMMAAPSERADIKSSAVKYLIGATILYASSGILTIIDVFSDNVKA